MSNLVEPNSTLEAVSPSENFFVFAEEWDIRVQVPAVIDVTSFLMVAGLGLNFPLANIFKQ